MITPAYSATATERVLPRMALDFTTGVLDPRVTFTRASTATVVGSNGLIQSAAINAPRFDYNPATLAPKGLLIEEQRANLLTYSEQFDNVLWLKSATTVTPNAVTSPDGTVNADKAIAAVSASTAHTLFQSPVLSLNTTYTISVFAKKAELDFLALNIFSGTTSYWTWYNLATGAIGTATGNQTRSITDFGNGWYRCTLTVTTAAAGAPNFVIYVAQANGGLAFVGDGTSGIYLYGAQLEAGAFATSYIPTLASQVTRNTDVVSMTGTNFSSWYNASEGAFEAEYSCYVATNSFNSKSIFTVSDGTNNNRIYPNISTTAIPFVFVASGGATQANMNTAETLANDAIARTVCAYKQDNYAASTNGRTPAVDNVALVPTTSQIVIGSISGFNCLFGHMRKIMYWPQRITNAETQAFSK
jgi:hypothetical protein